MLASHDPRVRRYAIDYRCHECGETHRVSNDFRLLGLVVEGGNLDDLFPAGDLPSELEALLGELVWCDLASDWLELENPAGVFLTPT